jgi:hypothetical protein
LFHLRSFCFPCFYPFPPLFFTFHIFFRSLFFHYISSPFSLF